MNENLLSRIEDASLNASAARQQWWLDGWIVRASPGKAKRSRCINAVAEGRLPLDQKLGLAATKLRDAGLPVFMRLTRFSLPRQLDTELAERGWTALDDTRVLLCERLPPETCSPSLLLPAGTHWAELDSTACAQALGQLSGSPAAQQAALAERLRLCPVPYRNFAIRRDSDHAVLACGQIAQEAELVGLHGVYTRQSERGRGLATMLCQRLLSISAQSGAKVAYLQVEAENAQAWSIYRKLGFVEGYAYHYRQAPTE